MKKYLLPNEGNFYKANLHCHSTNSDGKLTPEQIKDIYTQKGYSIVAYTDHDVLIPHHELTDDNFLALSGYELEINERWEGNFSKLKTCHMCFIALSPENDKQVLYHRHKYLFGNAVNLRDKLKFDDSTPDYERYYTHECISEMMKTGRDNGFFVTYNHPAWSLERAENYLGYNGMHAMEICNYSCVCSGYPDYNEQIYDEMLLSGKRIFCTATDDNHNSHPVDTPKCDSFGGFTVIKAPALKYTDITNALLKGNFYASQAPLIYDLYVEDGKIHITCSNAKSIRLNTGRRRTEIVYSEKNEYITTACFNVDKEDVYVRITVTDEEGKHANTNAFFVDEIL